MVVATLLIAAAEEGPPPLIDVDGTLFIQFAFFLIMLIVLSRVMFRPYLKLKEDRHKGIEGAREEARQMQERAQQVNADYDARLLRARQRGAEERARLRGEGASHERQVLGAAREQAQKALADARARIAGEATVAQATLQAESTTLVGQIVRKLLGREVA